MKLPKEGEAFGEWFNTVLEEAEILDKRYPVKGMNVWRPYGVRLLRAIDAVIREAVESRGYREVIFPTLIPETAFRKEEEHIRGFSSQVYWVTRGGDTELDVKLVLRPTSETAMYPIFALWVKSHGDLPIKVYQIVNVFRYETKQTRPMLRVREIHFFEAHTAHESYEEAERQMLEHLETWREITHRLAIPYRIFRRPEWDKFAGAQYSLAADTILPSGRTLQIGTIHQYGQNFSRAFGIRFETREGGQDYAYQTTYGISERLLAAVIAVHGDERGMVLPPEVAPIKVVIVPIEKKGREEEIYGFCRGVKESLEREGIETVLDLRDYRPGWKYYYWELRGVPIRVEVGPAEVDSGRVVVTRRDTLRREEVPVGELVPRVRALLRDIQECLRERAWREFESKVREFEDLEGVAEHRGIAKVPWCGDDDCALAMQEETGKDLLGTPLEEEPVSGRCPVCGREAKTWAYLAKPY